MASAKAARKGTRISTSNAPQVPRGMKVLDGGYAKSWNVDEMPVLAGTVSAEPKEVTLNEGTKKETKRQCVEVRTKEGDRCTLWESAALTALFERLSVAKDLPMDVWVAFKGYGTAKKGQNAPKLFDVAISD